MRWFPTLLALSTTLALAADPGIPVGKRVPDFSLIDQNGQTQSLRSVSGPKGLMLVFFRSADW